MSSEGSAQTLYDIAKQLGLDTLNGRSLAAKVTESLIEAKTQALASQEATRLSKEAQKLAEQKFADYYKLRLCYPNPCKNSGMCTVGVNLISYTCFCSSLFIGPTCESEREERLFSTYKAIKSGEKMIRIDDKPQK
jgi:hypothetical protein